VRADGDGAEVTVVNEGSRRGTEVVQVYVRAPESRVRRPERVLVGFAKVVLDPGDRTTVRVALGEAAFRYWDIDTHAWRTDPGRYEVLVGTSSRDIKASNEITWGRSAGS
jgi:beta-glucosidase